MRRFLAFLAGGIVLSALVIGCTQDLVNHEVDITSVRCSISRIDVEEDFATGIVDTLTTTKASFNGANFIWSLGDRIGIIPNTGSQIYFAVNEGAGTSTAAFDGGDWAMKSTGTFYAYYPLYPDIFLSKDHVSVSYSGQTQSGNNNNLHTGNYWTLYTAGTTAVGNALNFSFNHLTSFFKTYVTVPAGTYTKITFSAPSEVFIKDGYFDLGAQTPTIVGTTMTDILSLDLQNVTFTDETELTGYLVLAPVDITGIPITVTVYKEGTATYEYTLTKTSPMVPAKTYAFRATALTQLASSVSQANTLFASGATAVSITEPLTEDATVVLPNTADAVTLILPTTASSSKLTISYGPSASAYPATLTVTGPEGADLDIQAPNSTVTVNGIAYNHITSRTAANTCIIPAGVTVTTLKVIQGGVQVFGTVSQIDLSEQEDDAIINVSGTVTSLLGEDDEEYLPATGVSLNKTTVNLTVGATETLTATVAPVGAYPNVIWTSSDETVATVSLAGVVTAVAAGTATITAKTISGGFTASCDVTVEEPVTGFIWNVVSHSVVEPLVRYSCKRWFVSNSVLYCEGGGKHLTVDDNGHTITAAVNTNLSSSYLGHIGSVWTAPDGNIYSCFSVEDSGYDDYFHLYRFDNGNWTEIQDYGHFTNWHPDGNSIWKTNNYVYTQDGSTFLRSSNGYSFSTVSMSNVPSYFSGSNVWTSANGNAYYSSGTSHYLFNESSLSWTLLSTSGWPSITAEDIFIAGSITYWVSGSDCYMFNESSSTWTKISNDFRAGLYGRYVWSYNGKYYYSDGTVNKELKQGGQTFTTVSMLYFQLPIYSNPSICNVNGNMIWGQYLKTPGSYVWNKLSTFSDPIVTLAINMSGQYYYMEEYYDDEEYTSSYYLYPIDPSSGLRSFNYQYYGEGTTFYYAQSLWKDRNGVVHYSNDKRVFNDTSGRCYYCCDSNGNSDGKATHYRIYDETSGWSEPIPLNTPVAYTYPRMFWSDGDGNIYYTDRYTQYQLIPRN